MRKYVVFVLTTLGYSISKKKKLITFLVPMVLREHKIEIIVMFSV